MEFQKNKVCSAALSYTFSLGENVTPAQLISKTVQRAFEVISRKTYRTRKKLRLDAIFGFCIQVLLTSVAQLLKKLYNCLFSNNNNEIIISQHGAFLD